MSVPKAVAQDTADMLVRGGVRGIWNSAPVDLNLPEGVAVNNVHLSDRLHILSYRMNERDLFAAIDAAKKS
jgi:redox-sensing transcriptional repressor